MAAFLKEVAGQAFTPLGEEAQSSSATVIYPGAGNEIKVSLSA